MIDSEFTLKNNEILTVTTIDGIVVSTTKSSDSNGNENSACTVTLKKQKVDNQFPIKNFKKPHHAKKRRGYEL